MNLFHRLGWCAVLLFSGTLQADMLQGLKAYEQKQYTEAQQYFAELLSLGNELAAFNLGAMAYQGEGQQQDLVKALAYFMLAAELKHDSALTLLNRLSRDATEQQLDAANLLFERLKQSVVISPTRVTLTPQPDAPEPIKRVNPEYPLGAAQKSSFGYVRLRYLVNEQGDVVAVDTLDAFPENVFEKASVKAIKRWKYQPSNSKHLFSVQLSYALGGGVSPRGVAKVLDDNNLWQYAVAGSPKHQYALGTLFTLMEFQSLNGYKFDPELPLVSEPDMAVFRKRDNVRADFDGFKGNATVRVAPDGTIIEQIKTNFADSSNINNLVGLKLNGNIEAELYEINGPVAGISRKIFVRPVVTASRSMSGMFWWEQAARNGDLDAQRVMAAYDLQWENYLLAQQDGEVMAWAGTRLILEGQREQGMQLLEQAIAKNYQPAKEMKQQFM